MVRFDSKRILLAYPLCNGRLLYDVETLQIIVGYSQFRLCRDRIP